jgi:hypothetical protein
MRRTFQSFISGQFYTKFIMHRFISSVDVIAVMQAMKDVESMKTQSENLAAEYDRWAQVFYLLIL